MTVFWILSGLVTLLFLFWFFKKPCLVSNYEDGKYVYKPFGLKIWLVLIILIVSFIPIVNFVAIIATIIGLFVHKDFQDLTWQEIFPKNNKFFEFWNKEL